MMARIGACRGRAPQPVWRRTWLLVVGTALLGAAFGDVAVAQCALNVNPRPGDTGYRKRTYGCEGLYIQLQSATINVQVISLVRNGLQLPTSRIARIHVPESLPGLRDSVAVVGRGRDANLNWALDWFAKPRAPMTWPLEPVIREVRLDSSRIGLFGETRKRTGLGGPVYIPVDVRGPGEAFPASGVGAEPAPVELVIRIPAAGAMRYRLDNGEWIAKRPYNGDGYFLLELEPPASGLLDLEIGWRPSGSASWGSPESLSIFFW